MVDLRLPIGHAKLAPKMGAVLGSEAAVRSLNIYQVSCY